MGIRRVLEVVLRTAHAVTPAESGQVKDARRVSALAFVNQLINSLSYSNVWSVVNDAHEYSSPPPPPQPPPPP